MITYTIGDVSTAFTSSFKGIWLGVAEFLPKLVIALVIVLVGWAVGALLARIVAQVMRSMKVDNALRHAGVEDALRKGGIMLDSGHFVGTLVKWFVIVIFLIVAFDVLQLTQVTEFLQSIVLGFLPQVIIAVLILIVSAVIGDVMHKIVATSARTAGIASANLLGNITKWAIWIFAILIALSQLGIGSALIQTLFTGLVVAVSLALGLAFGLGGQNAASQFIEKVKHQISDKHNG